MLDIAWLYPPRFEAELMCRVARVLVEKGSPVLNVYLHSSDVFAGGTPHSSNAEEAARNLVRVRALLEYCLGELDAQPRTLGEAGPELAEWLAPPLVT